MSERVLGNGRYELLDELGSGGMATVYRAKDLENGTIRAVKVLDDRFSHKAEILKRFELEAMAMMKLNHDNIVKLHSCQLEGDERFIVMDFIDGESLLDRMTRGPLMPDEAVECIIPVLNALQLAHDNGIVHRDIKPHNILIDQQGKVYVSDFGIARCMDESEHSLTRTGMVMGTWAFMAPEQRADAKGVDHLADIYSAGATLYATVTGEVPKDLFAAELDPSIYRGISKPLETVIRRACAYWNSDRYPSARAMQNDLEITLGVLRNTRDVGRDFDSIQFRTNPDFNAEEPPPATAPGAPGPTPPKQSDSTPFRLSPDSPKPRPLKQGASEPEMRVGWMVFGVALVGCGIFFLMAQNLRDMNQPEAASAAPMVEIPEIKRKGRIPSDSSDRPVKGRPVLVHAKIENVALGDDLNWEVEIEGSNAYDKVQAWYRPKGGQNWTRSSLRRVKNRYEGGIPVDRMLSGGIEYWIEAKPYRKGLPTLTQGSEQRPIHVFVY